MEVAVAIGCDPATVFSAIAPLPPGVSEFLFAGFLRGEAVPLVAGKTVDLLVPAEAEIVLEGYVDPGERRREGPFGDHTGFYSLDDDFPVFHVTAVTRRRAPVYLTTIVGTSARWRTASSARRSSGSSCRSSRRRSRRSWTCTCRSTASSTT